MDQNEDDAVLRLTGAQKECLRLVAANFKSKEIAHQLGIGVDAVNKRLAGAMATLGVSSRALAARRLTAAEAAGGYQSLVGQTLAVEPQAIPVDPGSTAAPDESQDDPHPSPKLEEPQMPYSIVALPQSSIGQHVPPVAGARGLTPARIFLFAFASGVILEFVTRI